MYHPVACRQCETPVLKGIDTGITVQLSTLAIPFEAASVLSRYGVLVYHVRLYGRKIVSELWGPGYRKPENGWLVMIHECTRDKSNWQFNTPKYPGTWREPTPKAQGVKGFDD